MTSGFGVDASADGTSGTSSQDIRRILGAQFTEGVFHGCDVGTHGANMTYTVTPGVVAISTASDEIVLAPVDQMTVTTAPAPSSGEPRQDKVYIQQRFPDLNGDANIVLGVTSGAVPANAVQIRSFMVPAGVTNTDGATPHWPKPYAIQKNSSLGLLHYWQNTYSGTLSIPLLREGWANIFVPTDRRVTFKVRALLNSKGASGFDDSKYCEWGFLFGIDGNDIALHSTPGLHQAWATYEYSSTVEVSAGWHNVNLGAFRIAGPGVAETHYGVDGAGFGRRGIEFSIYDEGPVQTAFDVSPNF
jgi:hypothetical protein